MELIAGVILICAVVAHEFGHYIIPYFKKLNPRIKLKWYGLAVEWNNHEDMLLLDFVIISVMGVVCGGVVLLLFNSFIPTWFYTLYLLACIIDTWNIVVSFIFVIFKGYSTTIKDTYIQI
jgi:hypothetical protein